MGAERGATAGSHWPWIAVVATFASVFGITSGGRSGGADAAKGPEAEARDRAAPRHRPAGAKAVQAEPEPPANPGEPTGAAAILWDFANRPSLDGARAGTGDTFALSRVSAERVYRLGYGRVDVLLATVPDPLESPFPKAFDDGVSAVEVALERSGYVVDRFFDPWRRGEGAFDAGAGATAACPPGQACEPGELYEQQPGAILFRRLPDSGSRDLLLLLLVGETSTWGVHRRALLTALDVADGLMAARCSAGPQGSKPGAERCPTQELPLLGPATSGSTESLHATLTDWFRTVGPRRASAARSGPRASARDLDAAGARPRAPAPPFDLRIVSGSATAYTNQWILSTELQREVAKTYPDFRSTFAATTHSEDDLRRTALDYLCGQLGIRSIALLTESTTSYGAQFLRSFRTARRDAPVDTPLRVVNLPFPLHISKLRSEYERQHLDVATTPGPAMGAPRRQLPLASDEGSSGDSFPPKSKLTEAASDLVLTQILHAIATDDVRGVGIIATDPQDVLFLVRRVKMLFPNVAVFVFGADLLFLHDDAPYMRGVLVVSTYPLVPWNQRLSYPFSGTTDRLLFPSSAAQGVFNATVVLLGDRAGPDANVLEYGAPFEPDALDLPVSPPVWMTVVGDGAFWPLAAARRTSQGYLATYQPRDAGPPPAKGGAAAPTAADTVERAIVDARVARLTQVWTFPHCFSFLLALVFLSLLGALLALAYVHGHFSTAKSDRTAGRVLDLFLPSERYGHPHFQRFEVAVLLLTMVVVCSAFSLTALATVLPEHAHPGHMWQWSVLGFTVETALLAILCIHATLVWISGAGRTNPYARRLALAGTGLIAAILIHAVVPLVPYLQKPDLRASRFIDLMFLVERARNLGNGVSLLATLLLLAMGFVLWIIGHLRQVRIVEDAAVLRRLGVVPPAAPPTATAGAPTSDEAPSLLDAFELSEPMREVVRAAEGVWPSRLTWLPMLLVYADALWISRNLSLYEWRGLGWMCAASYATLLALLVFGCVRFARIWRKLERVLAKVAPLPVTEAFQRIPTELITSFERPWDSCVIEVWQRHCQRVFTSLRGDDRLRRRWSVEHSLTDFPAPIDLRSFLTAPVAQQIEKAESRAGLASGGGLGAGLVAGRDEALAGAWEEFLAMRLVAFIQYIRVHLANTGAVITAAILPVLWATTFYPLRENRFLLMLVLLLAGVAVAISAVVAVQMNRNYVLSRIEGTAAGQVTWDRSFVIKLVLHVAVPALTIISVKFPEIGRSISAVLGPLSTLTPGGP